MIEPLAELPPALPGRTLVLGAGGFLGSQVARWLVRRGARPRLFDLSVDSLPEDVRRAPGVEIVQGNLLDEALVRDALKGMDQVMQLISATVPASSVDEVELELRVNVNPTLRLARLMRAVGTPLIVLPSSGGTIYGDEAPAGGFPETAPLRPASSYGLGKLLTEEILGFEARAGGPRCLVLRIANAYGPSVHGHHRQGAINAFLARVRAGEPVRVWGDGSAVRDYVHVEDILSALSALVAAGVRDEVYNVGSGEGHSLRQVLDVIGRVTGRAVRIENAPGEYAGVKRSVLDVSKLRAATGWRPRIGLEDGVAHLWKSLET